MTAATFITGALQDLGVLGAGETLPGEQATDCLTALNDLVDGIGTERLAMYQVLRTVKTLTADTASYTIGSGGSIAIQRPLWIEAAGLVLDTAATTPTETPIQVFTDQEWAAVSEKTLSSSLSTGIWYDFGFASGLGTIYPWPIPSVSTTQLVLYTPQAAITSFTALTTDATFAPGARRMLRKRLAIELAPMFRATVTPELQRAALEAESRFKMANVRPSRQILPRLGGSSAWMESEFLRGGW